MGLIRALWDFAMWRGDVPTQRNPMELVTIKGATRRVRRPRSLTVEEFQQLGRTLGGTLPDDGACLCVAWDFELANVLL